MRISGRGIVFGLAIALLGPAPAEAQDWLQKGKELLGGVSKQESGSGGALSLGEIDAGLKEALRVATETVVSELGRPDGFNADPTVHIPLPASLGKVQSALQAVGMASLLDDLELRLNRAAEAATPKAKEIFWQAISEMTLEDGQAIYDGPDDAATRYFQGKMTRPLADAMRPVVDDSLAEVGAIKSYENMMGQYRSLPFMPDVKADLTQHVLEQGLDGIFHYLA